MWEDTEFTIAATWDDKANAPDGFVLEPDEAKKMLDALRGYEARLLAMKRKVARLLQMKPPSQDPSTVAAHVAMVGDGKSKGGAYSPGAEAIDAQLAYVTELADRIKTALAAIGENEQDQTKTIQNVDPDKPTGNL